jgi:hypothetical protein
MARGRPPKAERPKTKNEGQGIFLIECPALPDMDRIVRASGLIRRECSAWQGRGHPWDLFKISSLVRFNLDRLSAGLPTVRSYIDLDTYTQGRLMKILEPPKYQDPDAPVPQLKRPSRPITKRQAKELTMALDAEHASFIERNPHRRYLKKAARIAEIIASW